MARNRLFRRAPPTRALRSRFVIGCEGQTEYEYFEAIRQRFRIPAADIFVIPPDGSSPNSVVDSVIKRIEKERRQKRWIANDTAWAVFDGEEHWDRRGKRDRWNDAVQRAASKRVELVVSNPSFELWYLLHFQSQTATLDRQAAKDMLKAHVPDYDKTISLFDRLHGDKPGDEPLTFTAIERAEHLAKQCDDKGWDRWRNPSTTVYRLVKSLLAAKYPRGPR